MAELRRPGGVPDDLFPADLLPGIAVASGVDTDGDGRADTVVTEDGRDLVLHTDMDSDGFADQVLRIGPDGMVREVPSPAADPGGTGLGGLICGADPGADAGADAGADTGAGG